MKDIQIIDGAANAIFSLVPSDKGRVRRNLPDGQDMELLENLIGRFGDEAYGAVLTSVWDRPILKRDAHGIHGTLLFDNGHPRALMPTSKREIDWDSRSINQAQQDLFAKHR